MIEIWVTVDNNGSLKSIRAEGHSLSARKGSNIVCAAVSAQLRSVARVIDNGKSCVSRIKAESEGFLELEIDSYSDERWMAGVTDVLLAGLIETEREYPADCSIKLIKTS